MKRTRFWMLSFVLGVAATLATPLAQAQRPSGEAEQVGAGQPAAPQARAFTGTPIDVDYQGANLRTVLRQLSRDWRDQPRHRSERADRTRRSI